jgi:hypothetical protein
MKMCTDNKLSATSLLKYTDSNTVFLVVTYVAAQKHQAFSQYHTYQTVESLIAHTFARLLGLFDNSEVAL